MVPRIVLVGLVIAIWKVHAQPYVDEDFEVRAVAAHTTPVCTTGGTVDVVVLLTSRTKAVKAFALAVALEADPGVIARITSVRPGADLMRLRNWSPPDSIFMGYYGADDLTKLVSACDPEDLTSCEGINAVGVAQIVHIFIGGYDAMPPAEDLSVLELTVFAAAPDLAEGETATARVVFPDYVLGSPSLATFIASPYDYSYQPALRTPAAITVGDPSCPVTAAAFDMLVLPPGSGLVSHSGATADFSVSLATRVAETLGWSFGLALETDEGVDASITDAWLGRDVLTLRNGALPDFIETSFYKGGSLEEKAGDCDAEDPLSCQGIDARAIAQRVIIDSSGEVTLPISHELSVLGVSVYGAVPSFFPAGIGEARHS